MTNNYRRHLEWELRSKLEEAAELKVMADRCEQTWRQTTVARVVCERALERSIRIESGAKEVFRNAHSQFARVRQDIGEIQHEFFRTGEAEEDWHQ